MRSRSGQIRQARRALGALVLAVAVGGGASCTESDAPTQAGKTPDLERREPGATTSGAPPEPTPDPAIAERDAVRECFREYRRGILERDPKQVRSVVGPETIAYFDRLLDAARTPESDANRRLPLIDQLFTRALRDKLSEAELAELDGGGVLEAAISRGWIGEESVAQTTVRHVTIDEDLATAVPVIAGREEPARWSFRRDGETWKIDLRSIFAAANSQITAMAKARGVSEAELLEEMLGALEE